MRIPKTLQNLTESFQKLPGIGPKTAQRLAFYLLHVPQVELDNFSDSLINLKKMTILCSVCRNVSEGDPCPICLDTRRDQSLIMVVEQAIDIFAIERAGRFNGLYHVLHGAINPLDNIGPDEIFIDALFSRLKTDNGNKNLVDEIIIATNPTMEGDATAMYINKRLKNDNNLNIKITRLGMGIPTGADLEYADATTLREAILGRKTL